MKNMSEKPMRLALWCLAAAGFGLGVYVWAARLAGLSGFPLDDAWIHQTYARSLAQQGEWAFWPGEISAGSTSPLWTILLVPGQWIKGGMMLWTYFLGWLGLAGSAWLGQSVFRNIAQPSTSRLPIVAVFLALEWHLVWAAGSGMETILYVLILLGVFAEIIRKEPRFWLAGGLAGLAGWARPDGLTLLGPIVLTAVLSQVERRQKKLQLAQLVGGFLVLFLPYLGFNYLMAGSIWPNTFYAKQAEYISMTSEGMILRFFRLLIQPMVGAGILLLPGVGWAFYRGVKVKNWGLVSAILFWLGTTLIYAWRLPVVYQHARYLIPSMAAYFIAGFCGMVWLMGIVADSKQSQLYKFGWKAAVTLTLLAFYWMGGATYANDVGIIQTEMVAAARWVADNTGDTEIIAAHDIGALGYFGGRKILDLAGLISPDVIPFIRDETQLAGYLDENGAVYLVTFPGWYEKLEEGKTLIWQSEGRFAVEQGGENIAIYRWK